MVDLNEVVGVVTNVGFWALLILIIGGLLVLGVWLFIKWKKYSQFKCVIWGRDAFGNIRQTVDDAGIFVDSKTKNKRFFLRKANVGLEPDDIPVVGKKTVYLLRTGLKNFRFIKPSFDDGVFGINVSEEDVNWAVNAYERQKRLFNQNILMQYLPFMLLGFVSIVILIIFIYFFKNFDVLKDVALELKEASVQIAQARAGTVIVS